MTDSKEETQFVEHVQSNAPVPHEHPRLDIVIISALMLATSLAVIFAIPDLDVPLREGAWWLPFALVVAFALAEASMFNFVLRRESVAFSMSEVPLAIAVVFVTPGPALLARIIGGLVVIVALRPQPAYKLVFNLALFTMEMVCTYLFVRLLVEAWGDGDTALVAAVVAATVRDRRCRDDSRLTGDLTFRG